MHRIKVEKEFEDLKPGKIHIVTSRKIERLKAAKIKYIPIIKGITGGKREYEFEKPPKETKE